MVMYTFAWETISQFEVSKCMNDPNGMYNRLSNMDMFFNSEAFECKVFSALYIEEQHE